MGEYFLAVNPVKRQFIDPYPFGHDNRLGCIFDGSCGAALELLMMDSKRFDSVQPIEPNSPMRLVGLWLGDPVVIAGDDYGAPNPFGFSTTTVAEPDRNLHRMAEAEFADISYYALAMLCACRPFDLIDLADRADTRVDVLFSLGVVATVLEQPDVAQSLNDFCGQDWRDRFEPLFQERIKQGTWRPPEPLAVFLRSVCRA